MTEKQRKIDRHKALETLLERAAESEREEALQLSQSIEEGTIHPSMELLREYAAGLMDEEDTTIMANHIALCGSCSERLLKIQYIENAPKSIVESWTEKLKGYVSELLFTLSLGFPEEVVRGAETAGEGYFPSPGESFIFSVEAPADGYIVVFYGSEETDENKVIFPEADEDPRVSAGQQIGIADEVERLGGKHFLKAFWTRLPLFNPEAMDLRDRDLLHQALEDFLNAIEESDSEDWQAALEEFDVVSK